ncbi:MULTISPECIES: ribosome biogenesis GTPase Der [Jonquetella]|uniref:GTPase Der n=1 Tax=Jonquetella anthropi DSM 22815 TaxID=885272 RepID=H0UL01_9BACT|nr:MULTISPECIES: ribosome biogenesis GTPase Der [Jonquetella]EHM13360.1 ribosome-associated GTPase EngA [Jonquetella anthropi DSM 22815]ERL24885.1 ribosome-associated GTPase EngA [Jonquetella sp. BV3C21]
MAIVSIVGRPNVGKSSLFNRLVGSRRAIVDDQPGVTRDRLFGRVEWGDRSFYLVDTGGLLLRDDDPIMRSMRGQIQQAIEESDAVLFVVDGPSGVTWMDQDVADVLRKASSRVIVVINKLDDWKHDDLAMEAYSLGFDKVIGVSALHDRGIDELKEAVCAVLPDRQLPPEAEEVIKIALVGRPNCGKSSILNRLAGEDRSLVSDVAGTTRDAIDWETAQNSRTFRIVDTAGLRRKSRQKGNVEFYSSVRTMQAVDECDVAVFIMDASEPATEQDQRLVAEILDRGKGLVLVVNKWDLITGERPGDEMTKKLDEEFRFAADAPRLFTSALSGRGLHKLLDLAAGVYDRRRARFSSALLNRIVRDMLAFERLPSDGKGRLLRIFYCTQSSDVPPTFVFFVNDPKLVTQAFENHMRKKIRELEDFSGVPLRLFWRGRKKENPA